MNPPVLSVTDLRVDITTPSGVLQAVRGISFDIARGETLCIVGESGCGKSMTSLALMDLLPRAAKAKASKLRFGNEDLLGMSAKRRAEINGNRMAMIFQEPMTALNPAYTIGNQLTEVYLRHKGGGMDAAKSRAVALLDQVGIANARQRLDQYPHQLSGGLRQRVMIAMALMCEPDLLIADEPTTALDVTIQAQILRLLADIQKDTGIALLLITHDLGIVARIADRVAVMYAGQFVERANAEALFAEPRHPYTRGLIDCIPVPGKTLPGERLGTIEGAVPSLVGGLLGCAFRARCPRAMPECAQIMPWTEDQGHGWRCIAPLGSVIDPSATEEFA